MKYIISNSNGLIKKEVNKDQIKSTIAFFSSFLHEDEKLSVYRKKTSQI